MTAKPIMVGDHLFPSTTAAVKACSVILHRYEIGAVVADPADHEFLSAVLLLHPHASEKVGVGVVRYEVRKNPDQPNSRSFYLIRTDGTETEFGYNKALKHPSHEQELRAALRRAVKDQVLECLRAAFASGQQVRCAVTHATIEHPEDAHVDHAPPTFLDLAERFIADHGGASRFALSHADGQVGARLADAMLANEWLAFHREHARLRVVTRKANLSDLRRRPRDS